MKDYNIFIIIGWLVLGIFNTVIIYIDEYKKEKYIEITVQEIFLFLFVYILFSPIIFIIILCYYIFVLFLKTGITWNKILFIIGKKKKK
jgi:hypothetical protein